MSKSTGYVQSMDEVSKYITTMIDHAEKHGIKILTITAKMPMLDQSVTAVTKHGQDDLRETRSLSNNLQMQILKVQRRKDARIKELDDFIDSILCGDDDDD